MRAPFVPFRFAIAALALLACVAGSPAHAQTTTEPAYARLPAGTRVIDPSAARAEARARTQRALERAQATRPLGAPWFTLMTETFEGDFPDDNGWQILINPASPYSWNDEDQRPHSGSWSGWCAGGAYNGASDRDPGSDDYANNMNAWMVFGPFDLSSAAEAQVLFWYWNLSEVNNDHFSWFASKDGTAFWGQRTSGNSNGWQSVTFDLKNVFNLGDLRGEPNVWIAFNFESNASTVNDGAFVDDVELQLQIDEPPSISHSLVGTGTQNTAIPITTSITDNGSSITAKVHWRQGGLTSFTEAPLTNTGGSAYSGQIPASAVTARGLEYYVSATDGLGTSFVPFDGPDDPATITVNLTGVANSVAQPSGGAQSGYRMISVPYDVDDASALGFLSDDLGAYDSTQWRLFRYEGGAYHEYPDSRAATLTPGKAFWLIVRNGGRMLDGGPGQATSLGDSFFVTLQPGWNDVGHPFAFNVPWSLVRVRGNVEGPYHYEGSWRSPASVTTLEPWKGYAIRNNGGSTASLAIPPRSTALTTMAAAAESAPTYRWLARLEARCEQALDDDNVLGWSLAATNGRDALDYTEPPPIGEYVSLRFAGEGGEPWTSDVRAFPGQGHRWPIVVESRVAGDAPVRISWSGFEPLPVGFEAILIDPVRAIAIDARQQTSYAYPNAAHRELELVVGTSEFVRAAWRTLAVPAQLALTPGVPNPFRVSTRLEFSLPLTEHVRLRLYDLQGREVRTLLDARREPGRYQLTWDGREASGRLSPGGIYFVRMEAGAFHTTRKIVFAP